ncbi:MAG TPA: FAD-dependent oxidoreductase [Conexibacter sp.]|jgi:NAD(P)H-nitrite reductase large subunit|nr:FAD-dependent oxidoreductase [Conexibacter sp.]
MSERFELLAIGAGPAGFAAVEAYRDAGGDGAVALVAGEERMPYRRPPLTKELLRGEIPEAELPLKQETWLAEHGVRLIGGRAVALDADARTVELEGGRTLPYARCVLATGAEPTRLPVPGADDPGVRVLRSLDHLRAESPLAAERPGRRDRLRLHRLRDRRLAARLRAPGDARQR